VPVPTADIELGDAHSSNPISIHIAVDREQASGDQREAKTRERDRESFPSFDSREKIT